MSSKTIRGLTIEIGGNTQPLNKALGDVNRTARDLQSELRQVDRLLKLDPGNTDLIAQKQKILAESVENTSKKLETLKEAERQAQEQFAQGKIGEEQYRAIQREVIKTEQELKKMNAELAKSDWQGLTDNLDKLGKKATDIGKNMTTKVTLPILGIGAAASKIGMDFEAGMSEVAAISGATGEDLTRLEEKAREMGATTKFSATDAAEGLKYMAMAGWETEQMLAGLPGVLALAAASGEDLGTVSDIVTDAMTAFGLAAEEAEHFADVLAKASSSSNTNVSLMGETFKYVAPLAGSLGYSIEDTAHAIGLMANAGIKGSQAGTALRSMLTRMIKPTKESGTAMDTLGISMTNADGTMKSLSEVIDDLREAFRNLDPDQQAFYAAQIAGQEAMSGFLSIVNASDEDFIKLRDNIYDAAGAAEEMAATMQENNKGALTELKSALEELALKIYDVLKPAIAEVIEFVKGLVDWLNNLSPKMQKTVVMIAGLAAAIGPVLIVVGKMSTGLSALIKLFAPMIAGLSGAAGATGGVVTAIGGLTTGLGTSLLAIAPWVAGIAAMAGGVVALVKHLKKDAIPAFEVFDDTISESTQEALGSFMDLEKKATAAFNTIAWGGATVTEEMKNSVTDNTNQMADEVIAKLEEQKIEGLKHLQEMLDKSTTMSEEEKEEAIRIATEKYDEQIRKTQYGKDRIESILNAAKEANREITYQERLEIEEILEELKENSIELMTESQEEQEKILENLKNNSTRLTAEMMADVIKNSKEQKEKTIAEAEEEYNERIKFAELLKKDGTAESIALADNVIKEAERQRDETIAKAEETHEKVLEEVKKQGSDVIDQIDLDNGEIKSKWDELKDWFMKNPIIREIVTQEKEVAIRERSDRLNPWNIGKNAQGTNYWRGGLTWVGELGPELVELPKGSKIHNNQNSMAMMGSKVEHTGTITVKGVNNQNEVMGIVDIVMDELRREVRA